MTSVLKVDNIQNSSGTQAMNIHSSGFIIPPAGGIIQMQYTQFTSTSSTAITASTDTVLTDLTVNITPTSTNSIIRLEAQVYGEFSNRGQTWDSVLFFYRDSTKLSHPVSGNRNVGVASMLLNHESDSLSTAEGSAMFQYFDSPSSTSQITYKVGIRTNTGVTLNLNRTVSDTDAHNYERYVSSIIATEIAG